jgi:hypothetical protein
MLDENLNKSYCYIPNTEEPDEFDKEYVKSRFLKNYEYRAEKSFKFLRKQKWVDNSKLIVAWTFSRFLKLRHLLLLNNKKVTHLGHLVQTHLEN